MPGSSTRHLLFTYSALCRSVIVDPKGVTYIPLYCYSNMLLCNLVIYYVSSIF